MHLNFTLKKDTWTLEWFCEVITYWSENKKILIVLFRTTFWLCISIVSFENLTAEELIAVLRSLENMAMKIYLANN